ncbi:MAG: hypothetical protein WC580_02150 [Agrococcus sp.]
MARRPLAAALVLGASALVLTGCIPLPPALPTAPTAAPAGAAGSSTYTVDDGLGDVWSFRVTGLVDDPPLLSGEPEPGTRFVAIVIDGEHLEGTFAFKDCFDMFIQGTDGELYDFADTYATVTAENDIYQADDTSFTGAHALVQLPEDVDPDLVVFRSHYGYPEVADTVIDVE